MKRPALLLTLLLAFGRGDAQGLSAALALEPVHGGLLVTGKITAPKDLDLTGVWGPWGRARLTRCAPRCAVVGKIPAPRPLVLGSETEYRVVLSGKPTTGQKVALVLRFAGGQILNTTATVRAAR